MTFRKMTRPINYEVFMRAYREERTCAADRYFDQVNVQSTHQGRPSCCALKVRGPTEPTLFYSLLRHADVSRKCVLRMRKLHRKDLKLQTTQYGDMFVYFVSSKVGEEAEKNGNTTQVRGENNGT
jgi:hypothetical protein